MCKGDVNQGAIGDLLNWTWGVFKKYISRRFATGPVVGQAGIPKRCCITVSRGKRL